MSQAIAEKCKENNMNEEVLKETAETTETTNTELDNNVEVGASDVADTGKENDFEFSDNTDSEETEQESPEGAEKVNEESAKKTNAKFARERRKKEEEARLAKIEKETKVKTIIETLDGVNPYTNEKMEDEADVKEYLTMREIEKSGKDPITDFSSYQKQKAKEEAEKERVKKESEEWIQNDAKDFKSKHPDVNLDELIKDELFSSIAKPQAGKIPMTKIYEIYSLALNKIEEKAVARTAQAIANQQSSIGALKNTAPSAPKSVEHMTREERDRLVERARMGERVTF